MTITIDISKDAESRLRERAGMSGKPVEVFVRELVEREAEEPTWEEIVGPIHDEFEKSGMTQEELDEFSDELIRDVRADRALPQK